MHLLQDTPSLAELKLLYYSLLIRYHEHANAYTDICRCYKAIYEVRLLPLTWHDCCCSVHLPMLSGTVTQWWSVSL